MVANKEREQLWRERVAQWQASGTSQQAWALEHGFPIRQVGYWVRRLAKSQSIPALLPVRVTPPIRAAAAAVPISLCSERGWTVTLPSNVPASWLAELMRAL
ncbi:hypothetical protein F2P44_32605 [Massilia sp. CCM 8695]|uniref:Transposase n=1 Tax=Massilia frigida TaxID=2609281 RepID=A0ABX0NES9_9BURK|nr:hypothetical protein [Massilia frigida]NHZ83970.1 hypothetical protein [Massilia frigida]